MADERLPRPPRRRVSDQSLGTRVTVLEEQFAWHLRASDATHAESTQLLKKLDERADKQDLRMYGLVGALTVLGVLGQAFLPLIRDLLKLPA